MGVRQVDHHSYAVLVEERVSRGNLRLNMPQSGGSGQHIDIPLLCLQAQAEIAVILLPVQEIEVIEDALRVRDGAVQVFIEKAVHIIAHAQIKETFVLDRQLYGLPCPYCGE